MKEGTCDGECGLRRRFPISCDYKHCEHIKIAELEAEKPAEEGTARLVAQSIIGMALADYSGLERQLENDTLISIDWIQAYAHSYHLAECAKCKALPEDDVLERAPK